MTGDGVIGFTRAFLYAGASSVIATAWDVPDVAGYEVMRRFYRSRRLSLSGSAGHAVVTSRALHAAQLDTLAALRRGALKVPASAATRAPGTAAGTSAASAGASAASARASRGKVALPEHPLFWAGFVLVGEP